ncbi:MAG: hypothetical protein E6H95_12545, partial [Chloroflexi bacterium]
AAAGRKAEVVRLRGDAWPGLIDSHIHLEGLIDRKLAVDLTGAKDLGDVLGRTREWVKPLPKDAWVVGSGWYNDAWPSAAFPTRRQLDAAVGGRPAYLERKDGHSAWVSTAALRAAGIDVASENPAGGVIDRDGDGAPTGILRETAMDMVLRLLPTPSDADLDAAMTAVLRDLAALGLTSVHSMDTARALASLQRIRVQEPLPVRVTYNMPVADLPHAERMGVRSGWGDEGLRIWGVKAFLDGSLGSRTAARPGRPGRALRTRRAERVPPRDRRRRRAPRPGRAGAAPPRLVDVAAAHRARAVREPQGHDADGPPRRHRFDAADPCRRRSRAG